MFRLAIAAFALASLIPLKAASLLPDYYYQVAKADSQAVAPPDGPLFEEYGFDQSERATYGKLTVTSWRFRDTTGAIAGYQYLRPAEAKPCDLGKVAECVKGEAIVALGNYVLQFAGAIPKGEEVNLFLYHAPKYEQAPLPALPGQLPDGEIPNSTRYILGPVGLDRFGKGIPPSTVAFSLNAEGEYARYKGSAGELGLLVFSYPTPNMAREQSEALRKVSGAIVKRTGSLVGVVMNPPSTDDAERLLSRLNYEASVTMNQLPARNQAMGWARALLSMFALAGIILLFCVFSGVLFGVVRVLSRKLGHEDSGQAMIRLHLEGK